MAAQGWARSLADAARGLWRQARGPASGWHRESEGRRRWREPVEGERLAGMSSESRTPPQGPAEPEARSRAVVEIVDVEEIVSVDGDPVEADPEPPATPTTAGAGSAAPVSAEPGAVIEAAAAADAEHAAPPEVPVPAGDVPAPTAPGAPAQEPAPATPPDAAPP